MSIRLTAVVDRERLLPTTFLTEGLGNPRVKLPLFCWVCLGARRDTNKTNAITKTTNKPTSKDIAASIAARMGLLKSLEDFDPEESLTENDKLKKACTAPLAKYREHTMEVNKKLAILGLPMIVNDTADLPQKDITKLLPDVMACFPKGANGREIAAMLALPETADHISLLYWTEGQTSLKKNGEGIQTKYALATEADKEQIAKDQARERADLEDRKEKRKAKKAATAK